MKLQFPVFRTLFIVISVFILCINTSLADGSAKLPELGPQTAQAQILASRGYIVDHRGSIGNYNLFNSITRAEIVGTILKLKEIDLPDTYECKGYFIDVSGEDDWICRAVEIAADYGIITRSRKGFKPNDTVSRSEALGMLMLALEIEYQKNVHDPLYKNSVQQWQIDVLEGAVDNALISESDTYHFRPDWPAGRITFFGWALRAAGGEYHGYGYHTDSTYAYYEGYILPNIKPEGFRVHEGNILQTTNGVYKRFKCSGEFGACVQKDIVEIGVLNPEKISVHSFEFLSDGITIWNCSKNHCFTIDADATKFECNKYLLLCGDEERVYFTYHGEELYANSKLYRSDYDRSIAQVYMYFMERKLFDTAESFVLPSALSDHEKLVSLYNLGAQYLGGNLGNEISLGELGVFRMFFDEEKGKVSRIIFYPAD